ncbi:MAG: hypothetical protein PVI21_01825 [Candidatus Woesebacteria bacterium]|jgi:hypothetical protein
MTTNLNPETINTFIKQCRTILQSSPKPDYMREKEQESYAADICGLCLALDLEDEDFKKYPLIEELTELAADLEWSNVPNTTIAWRRIRVIIDELDQQVNGKN